MNLDEAKTLMLACSEVNSALNKVCLIVETIEDSAVRSKLKFELGNTCVAIYGGLMRPIIRDFPELDPDGKA